ncbi:MAG: FAD-dependent oxidoreductase [Oscillospiraceae bacterium]|nr:FAD-dependent oxidoreductase [Oscillospiraceae bacterium]
MKSLWHDKTKLPQFPPLEEDIQTDVLIIGGGMAGILCAYFLGQAGVDYVLVEADRICSGVTGNTTAKITSQHGFVYQKLLKEFGPELARQYYQANEDAINCYRELCRDIDCDFVERDSYVYTLNRPEKLEKEIAALVQIGAKAELAQPSALPFPTAGAIRFRNQAQFDPLKFVASLAKGLHIFERTKVQSFDGNVYRTDRGIIRANKTIVATHFPIWNKHGSYFLKLYQHRSYVLALENAPQVDGMYVDESGTGLSFRNQGELLLLGGGSHRTGKQGGGWEELEQTARIYYPGASIKYRWATQDCMSLDGMPYIGQYSKHTPNLFVATGFNKWGMTSSMVAATILRDLVQGKDNSYEKLFSPSRSILRPQLAANAVEAVCNLLTPTKPRCPHMGCALKWNPQEHTWDCPCHGSRFGQDGKLLDGPATGDFPQKK